MFHGDFTYRHKHGSRKMLFKEVLLWSPPHQSNTMTGPQNPAVSRHTFDKRLPGTPAKAIIIGLLDHLQLPKIQ